MGRGEGRVRREVPRFLDRSVSFCVSGCRLSPSPCLQLNLFSVFLFFLLSSFSVCVCSAVLPRGLHLQEGDRDARRSRARRSQDAAVLHPLSEKS